jgi:hypothetical protein
MQDPLPASDAMKTDRNGNLFFLRVAEPPAEKHLLPCGTHQLSVPLFMERNSILSSRSLVRICGLILLAGSALTGCQPDNTVTKQEEAQFKNPSKEMPPEARKIMQEHSAQPPQAAAPGK